VAIDAIVFTVNPKLNIPGLTVKQIQGIYTEKITNWQAVGSPNLVSQLSFVLKKLRVQYSCLLTMY
jgi:ABC-type phosphate transport system substrate-binding protein